MKKIFTMAVAVCASMSIQAKNYYLSSSSGNDSNPTNNTPATAWQTIAKFNTAAADSVKPGDSVLFKWGDSFEGEILVKKSGTSSQHVVYAAYGSPAGSPVIKGYAVLTGWTLTSSGIYETTCSTCGSTLNSVSVDLTPVAMGRYPNADATNGGYLNFESHSGKTSITDNQLTGSPSWSGAELVLRTSRYTIDRDAITTHSGSTINYTVWNSSLAYEPTNNFGYFIQNSLSTLDQFGEWYYNPSTKKVYMYFGANTPSNYEVRASTATNFMNMNARSYIDVIQLSFEQSNGDAIKMYNCSHIYMLWNQIFNSGLSGVNVASSTDIDLVGNYITYSNGSGIKYDNTTYSEISYNEVTNTGLLAGMGENGTSKSIGISQNDGNDNTIFFNRVENTGYIGILFDGDNTTVNNNYVNNYTLVKDDGGGIYTWTGLSNPNMTGRTVEYNTILNGVGAGYGTNAPTYKPSYGIYLDDKTGGVSVRYNSIAHCGADGIYFHMAHDITCTYNTIYDAAAQFRFGEDNASYQVRNLTVTNNIAVAKTTSQMAAVFTTDANDIASFGTFNNNYYCRPFDDKLSINSIYKNSGTTYNLLQDLSMWQAYSGLDGSSNKSSLKYYPYVVNTAGSEKVTNPSFDTPTALGVSFWAPSGTYSATRDNTSKITGTYSCKIDYTNTNAAIGIASINVGSITSGSKYVLTFKTLGVNSNKTIRVYLQQAGSPYSKLSEIANFKLTNSVTSSDVLFTASASESSTQIIFEVDEQDGVFYLDDVSLKEATSVTINNPDDYIRFEYNETDAAKNISLSGSYKDVAGTSYSGTVSIPAFSSRIFLKVSGSYKPTGIVDLTQAKDFDLYPNPTNDQIHIILPAAADQSTEIMIFDLTGKLINSTAVQLNSLGQIVQIDVNSLSSGMYLVKMNTIEGIYQKKFIKID